MANKDTISSKWFLSLDEIERSDLPDYKKPESSKSILIKNVSLEVLISKFQKGNPEIIKSKDLFHPRMNKNKTDRIIDAWSKKIPLLPPLIVFIPESGSLDIEDGRHRINIANYFNEITIPIIVPINDYQKVILLLNSLK